MTADQRRAWLIQRMADPIQQSTTIALQRFSDAYVHALNRDASKAGNRIQTITSILTPNTGALWSGWAELYRRLWREKRLEIGDTHGVEWRQIGNEDAAKAIASVRMAQTTPLGFLEMHLGTNSRLLAVAMRSQDAETSLKAWKERVSSNFPDAIAHVAMTVAHRLSAITARQVVRPEFLVPDPTIDF